MRAHLCLHVNNQWLKALPWGEVGAERITRGCFLKFRERGQVVHNYKISEQQVIHPVTASPPQVKRLKILNIPAGIQILGHQDPDQMINFTQSLGRIASAQSTVVFQPHPVFAKNEPII